MITIFFIFLFFIFLFSICNFKEKLSFIINHNGQKITNTKYVDQGIASVSFGELYTDKVGTCSVMILNSEKKNFLAHVDAHTSKNYLINTIKKNFNLNKLSKIYVWSGSWCNENCDSTKIIKDSLIELNLIDKLIYSGEIDFDNIIKINKNGKININ